VVTTSGANELPLPQQWHIDMHRDIMLTYLTHLKEMQNELKSTLQRIAVNNTGEFINTQVRPIVSDLTDFSPLYFSRRHDCE
jgi:hypothetical protein